MCFKSLYHYQTLNVQCCTARGKEEITVKALSFIYPGHHHSFFESDFKDITEFGTFHESRGLNFINAIM